SRARAHPCRHALPTRRSSDLAAGGAVGLGRVRALAARGIARPCVVALILGGADDGVRARAAAALAGVGLGAGVAVAAGGAVGLGDRKSTRLNSSHGSSSYADF